MEKTGKTVALLVAAGNGSRAGGELPKQFTRLAGKSLVAHALEHLGHSRIDEIRVVIGSGQEALYEEATLGLAVASPILGGATRQQSVRNGLEAIASDEEVANVLIHDAARPFVPARVIDALLDALAEDQGAVPVLPVVDSLAIGDGELGDPVPRDRLVRVQTPQAFRFDAILRAHRSYCGAEATDDAQVARAGGIHVATVEGDAALEKLTYPADFRRASQALDAMLVSRCGMGFDVHRYVPGKPLWLGGLLIPHDHGLEGHSDADVVLHALTDAILGAIGEGDIGDHFPPSDAQWRGAASSIFLEHARGLVDERRGRVEHVDVTIICETPRIGPHREAMRANVARLLRVPVSRVSIKATTTERLGFTGRGEGMAAQAIATVRVAEDL